MKKYIFITVFSIFFGILNIHLALASTSDIAISEVMFDPTGIDTGLEYVVVKNFGNTDVNMTGWDLYPDGIGYFTFPSFILNTNASVKILLHKSGTNNQSNLYHVSASGNLGNSSGSVALFSSTAHNKTTIVSFVRYHRAGSVEHKTWESTAVSAGIWTAGTFVDIAGAKEGQKILLKDFSYKTNTEGWSLSLPESTPQPSLKQNTISHTTSQLNKSQEKTQQSEVAETDLAVSYADATTPKKIGNYFWLLIGVGCGALLGLMVLILKKVIGKI